MAEFVEVARADDIREGEVRVLIAMEDRHRAYRETIESAIRAYRPRVEVAVSGLDALQEEVARLEPGVLISSRLPDAGLAGFAGPAWIELAVEPEQPTRICVGGRLSEMCNPGLEELLSVIDEAERLTQSGKIWFSATPCAA